jgi:hypothetical protein
MHDHCAVTEGGDNEDCEKENVYRVILFIFHFFSRGIFLDWSQCRR